MSENEKPKNDYFSPYADYEGYTRDRSLGLTVFLIFIIAVNTLFLLHACGQVSQLSRQYSLSTVLTSSPGILVDFILQIGGIICAIALWGWKEWGYYGLIGCYGLSIVLRVLTSEFVLAGSGIFWVIVLIALVRHKPYLLE